MDDELGQANDREGVDYGAEAPTVEVTVYRGGSVIHSELCESAEAASAVVDRWSELDGVECSVDDLSVRHHAGEIMEPGPDGTDDDEAFPRS